MHLAELGELERQVAIRLQTVLEDLHMARAVHWLDGVDALVVIAMLREEHHLAVLLHVTGGDPELRVHELRRIHLDIAGVGLAPANVVLERLEQGPALRMPKHRAWRLLLEMEQVQLAPKLPMVALLGLLELLEVGIE